MSDAGQATLASAAPDPNDDGLTLKEYKAMFDDFRTLANTGRIDSALSRDYYDGIQLTDTERATLAERGQPPIVINRVQRAIDGILGVVEQSKTDPRALMRNPPDQQTQPQQAPPMGHNGGPPMQDGQQQPQNGEPPPAPLDAGDIATMTLRFIKDTTHFAAIKMDVLENGIIEGCGAAIVECVDQDVLITQVRWEEFFYDPRSRNADFSDARYMGMAKWMYADDVAALYPKAKDDMYGFATGNMSGATQITWEDRPADQTVNTPWIDKGKKRVMVVELYHRKGGTWYRCVFWSGDVLERTVSPYKDDKGRPICPIEGWSCYVTGGRSFGGPTERQNDRYGIVKSMRDIQDEINQRRSKALFSMNSRQVQQVDPSAPPIAVDTVRKEAAQLDGVLPPGWNFVPHMDVTQGNLELLQEAKAEMDRLAPTPALIGRHSNDASGRAQQISQQAGMTELARVLGRFSDWENRMYSRMWGCARQFYTDPKWVRVTNDTGAPQYVRINEPTVGGLDQFTGQQMPGPPKNHIAEMDVDIVLDKIPDTATLEQEIWSELMDYAKANPGSIPVQLLIKHSPLPKRGEILKELAAYQSQQAPMQQAAAQTDIADKAAGVDKTNSETKLNEAKVDLTEAQTASLHAGVVDTALNAHLRVTPSAALQPGMGAQAAPELPPPGDPNGSTGAPDGA